MGVGREDVGRKKRGSREKKKREEGRETVREEGRKEELRGVVGKRRANE